MAGRRVASPVDARAADLLLERVRAGGVLWLVHVNADPDSVGSAAALAEAFGGEVGAPEGVSRAGRALAQDLGLAVDPWPHPENFRTVVAVDTSSRSQLGRLGPRVAHPCLVDHHAYGDLQEGAPAKAWDPTRASCAEVALALLDLAGVEPSRRAALALLAGLVADTARFRHADPRALRDAARLSEVSGAKLEDVYSLLDADEEEQEGDEASRRKATLVAAQRMTIDAVNGWMLATSEVGAFDAAAALALVKAGADVAVVSRERRDRSRLSLRASPRALAKGLHLGQLANEAAIEVGWSGGGHEGAAGMSGPPPLGPARAALLRRVRSTLEAW